MLLLGSVVLLVTNHQSLVTHPSPHQAVYYCPMHPTYTADRPGDCPICNMKLVKKESEQRAASSEQQNLQSMKDICYLHNCPMAHEGKPCPMLVVAKAGESVTCPICGTHMVEASETIEPGSLTGYAAVLLSPQKQQLIGVKTAPVERRRLAKTIRTVGTIAHDPELYQTQSEYIQAVQAVARARTSGNPAVIEQAQRLVDAATTHLRHMGLSQELVDELDTKTEADHSLLFGRPGEPVWVYAKLYEADLPLVRTGQEVVVEAPSWQGPPLRGLVRAIDPMVDAATRTVRIRAQLDNPEGLLKPDMYVDVLLSVDFGERLSVPKEAVFDTGQKRIVFIDKDHGLFEPRDVRVGVAADEFVEILDGVAEGERAITSGNFLIDSESRLKAALQGMSGEGHQHGQ